MSRPSSGGLAAAVISIGIGASLVLTGCSGSGPYVNYGEPTKSPLAEPAPSSTELPSNFPANFPLIDRDVVIAYDLGTGWVVWLKSSNPAHDFTSATDALEAAGFTKSMSITDSSGSHATFAKGPLQVQLSAGKDAQYGESVAYTIYRTE
ncbi:MAG: hypothetical protein EPN91_06875 [Salinibacterium sp.]|nr:MAG: hypothetical protein EPN91_06875 [Salinibacterium sp.]